MHKLPMTYAKPQSKWAKTTPRWKSLKGLWKNQSCLQPLQGREQAEFHERYQYFCRVSFQPTGIAQISHWRNTISGLFLLVCEKLLYLSRFCHSSPAMHDVLVAGQLSPHGHGTLCQGSQQRQWLSCCGHGCRYGFCATWQARDCPLARRNSVDFKKDALFMTLWLFENMIRSLGDAILKCCFSSYLRHGKLFNVWEITGPWMTTLPSTWIWLTPTSRLMEYVARS